MSEGLHTLGTASPAALSLALDVGSPADVQRAEGRLQYLATLLTEATAGRQPASAAPEMTNESWVAMIDGRPEFELEPNGVQAAISRCSEERWGAIAHMLADRATRAAGEEGCVGHDTRGPLSGVAFVAKNAFDVKGLPTYAGGPFDAAIAPAQADAAAIARLTAAGATLVGTTHMDEYAYGFLGQNPHHGRVHNPRAPECIAGGSSSGSAAAVAAGLVPLALGTDTNGSIRVPAALCGIFGIKPSFGGIPREGLRGLAPSLDHVGLLAADLTLLEATYQVLTGRDVEKRSSIDRVSLGVAAGDFKDWCDSGVWRAIQNVVPFATASPQVTLHGLVAEFAASSIITAVEARQVHAGDLKRHPGRYSAEVTTKLHAAEHVTPRLYERAKTIQSQARDKYLSCLATVDVLLTPTLPIFSPLTRAAMVNLRGVELRVADALSLFVRPFSLAGLPALTVPLSTNAHQGVAIQLVCAPGAEDRLWSLARRVTSPRTARDVVPHESPPARPEREHGTFEPWRAAE